MSWIEYMGYDAYDGDDFRDEEQERKEELSDQLGGFKHKGKGGREIDVRDVNYLYADRLIKGYRKRVNMSDKVFYNKPMIVALGIIKEEKLIGVGNSRIKRYNY